MTSPEDASPVKPPPSFSGAPIVVPKSTYSADTIQSPRTFSSEPRDSPSIAASTAQLPYRNESPSRSASPSSRLSSSVSLPNRASIGSPLGSLPDGGDNIRSLIIRSFAPPIAIFASDDTEDLVRQKGFNGGFRELLRPFGENIAGKVVVRDSVGSSRAWEDYSVHFVDLYSHKNQQIDATSPPTSPLVLLEEVLQRRLDSFDDSTHRWSHFNQTPMTNTPLSSPFYQLLLRRLLSVDSPTPHETFSHPVACVITISSRNKTPLESLRQLYAQTTQGNKAPLPYVHAEFLRYYVLVHDEDRDDIAESTKLYDQMKRHFGLHCHLLRLRSNQCVVTDDDSMEVPLCEWLSPEEELSKINETSALIDLGTEAAYLFESDVTAIKTLVRELVVQSVIPFMENKVALWNDQVASRRRGLSGRFMSMSRRWAGFGSGSKSNSSGSAGSMTGNYDAMQGFYKPEVPEAILRKLGDFAFMLRDYKLAASTYDLVRSDYSNDKAWKYHAGAHEMCALSMLLNPLSSTAKNKLEGIDQMIDTACYSYLTRCSDAVNTLRCLTLSVELLKSRGGSATEGAARWAMRVMELGLTGPIGQALFTERVSACYASKTSTGGARWGSRRRKAAMWSILASDSWLKLGKPAFASVCLEDADRLYAEVLEKDGIFSMPDMREFIDNLKHAVKVEYLESKGVDTSDETVVAKQLGTEETSEKLDKRSNRRSLIVTSAQLENGPLNPLKHQGDGPKSLDDDFE
ncbi:ER-golgi trafficking TRAPP I complex 85 kDa subunit-domain-containing protein [Talaromyces proteolyticus]|uniref:ER-golgi trafficking TRAPP I complex 85 kDa subunit-domain-containing protein n=1 Tax=Talaromyces proteolyticus TaxID=1131652 RepID=A0AAD4PXS0_9EURO|nr:ER-golgi trafficking TRAPP I complex 85 kDa subunit-domain-containing protein [Talaromyces proteolyticus]KAH8696709.1 ER-golgi trafficking TRAPP I complex 85 kDa subunit-domain-containing protein [Talaromyces proteolyticus]